LENVFFFCGISFILRGSIPPASFFARAKNMQMMLFWLMMLLALLSLGGVEEPLEKIFNRNKNFSCRNARARINNLFELN
jgi:hypothetical protein